MVATLVAGACGRDTSPRNSSIVSHLMLPYEYFLLYLSMLSCSKVLTMYKSMKYRALRLHHVV